MTMQYKGIIKQIVGPVIDVYFEDNVPAIKNALIVEASGEKKKVVLEVSQHIGLNRVRCIALSDTAGLIRGKEVLDTGAPISVPVGEHTLGRLFNVLGETIDGKEPLDEGGEHLAIHQNPPPF